MGHVIVQMRISHLDRPQDAVVVDALVDTGSTLTTIPRELANRLGLPVRGQNRVRTASGVQTSDRSMVWVEIQGKDGFAQVSISDNYPGVLLGVTTMEVIGFAVDPTKERLIDAELLAL